MLQVFQDLQVTDDDEVTFDITGGSIAPMPVRASIDKNKIILKGNLIKKNRYWKK